jgi:hypothetical protein
MGMQSWCTSFADLEGAKRLQQELQALQLGDLTQVEQQVQDLSTNADVLDAEAELQVALQPEVQDALPRCASPLAPGLTTCCQVTTALQAPCVVSVWSSHIAKRSTKHHRCCGASLMTSLHACRTSQLLPAGELVWPDLPQSQCSASEHAECSEWLAALQPRSDRHGLQESQSQQPGSLSLVLEALGLHEVPGLPRGCQQVATDVADMLELSTPGPDDSMLQQAEHGPGAHELLPLDSDQQPDNRHVYCGATAATSGQPGIQDDDAVDDHGGFLEADVSFDDLEADTDMPHRAGASGPHSDSGALDAVASARLCA